MIVFSGQLLGADVLPGRDPSPASTLVKLYDDEAGEPTEPDPLIIRCAGRSASASLRSPSAAGGNQAQSATAARTGRLLPTLPIPRNFARNPISAFARC
jgi:hypothetical protein